MITMNSTEDQQNLSNEFEQTVWKFFPAEFNKNKEDIEKLWLHYSEVNEGPLHLRFNEETKQLDSVIVRRVEFKSPNKRSRDFNNELETVFIINNDKVAIQYYPEFKDSANKPAGFVELQPRTYELNDSNLTRKVREFINQCIKNNDILNKHYKFEDA